MIRHSSPVVDRHAECDCERRCSNPKHRESYHSPLVERRNRSVLGRLKHFASRSSHFPNDSHSSDYDEPEENKKEDIRFSRDASERNSSSWTGRVRDLHRDVKKKISKFRTSKGPLPDDETGLDRSMPVGSSVESLPSGSGSSLQPPTPTSSNCSSTSAGEDEHGACLYTILGRARALVDCNPSPYDRDGLAFKKGDIIDIIAKHKTGIWVGVAQGKMGHFKFINVEEISEERKHRHRRRKMNNDWLPTSKKPETLEELLKELGLEEYLNVLILNGYDQLDTFKEIEKEELDSLGINAEHVSKLLRAAEVLQDLDAESDNEDEEDESQLIQSPRDSGCYASHDNLAHSSQKSTNGQSVANPEEQDTSHSESGTHSREGQDSAVTMNNLDFCAEFSADTTLDDVANAVNDCAADFNIISQPKEMGIFERPCEDTRDFSSLDVPRVAKSSPGSPRKFRHVRNKSHSYSSKETGFDDYHGHFFREKHLSPAVICPERSSFAFGWIAFSKNQRSDEDHGSDPVKYMYKRIKQRKGSLQTLIHETRVPSPAIISQVNQKLMVEKIYLYEEPYTDKTGFCGIPPALVQRYAEELQQSITDVADALDHIRIISLQQQSRCGVPNDFLPDSCNVPVIEVSYVSLRHWLISLGLPMYESQLYAAGFTQLHHLAFLGTNDLENIGIQDPYHQEFLKYALDVLCTRLHNVPDKYPPVRCTS